MTTQETPTRAPAPEKLEYDMLRIGYVVEHETTTTLYGYVRLENGRLSMGYSGYRFGRLDESGRLQGLRERSGIVFQEGMSRERLNAWATIEERWHLNDLRAGCVHQRRAGWDLFPIDREKPLNAYGKHHPNQHSATWNMLIWVYPSEVPGGLMCVPCPECGYKYGSAWQFEPLPRVVHQWAQEIIWFKGAVQAHSESLALRASKPIVQIGC